MKLRSIGILGFALALATTATVALAAPDAPPATAPAAPHYTTADTTIGDLLADPAAKAIIDKHIPGLSDNPSIAMASGMTLRVIQPMAADKITEKMLDDIDADLAKLPAK
jgi:hypothetical protein